MRLLSPYRTREGLARAIDNGGRWYNLIARAGDGRVSAGELKAAGGSRDPLLFLEMAMWELPTIDQNAVIDMLDPDLGRRFRERETARLSPSRVRALDGEGQAVILEGYPRRLKDDSRFGGFMMLPIQAGQVTTMMMIPLTEHFVVWEVFDDASMMGESAIVLTPNGRPAAFSGPVRIAGKTERYEDRGTTGTVDRSCVRAEFYSKLEQAAGPGGR